MKNCSYFYFLLISSFNLATVFCSFLYFSKRRPFSILMFEISFIFSCKYFVNWMLRISLGLVFSPLFIRSKVFLSFFYCEILDLESISYSLPFCCKFTFSVYDILSFLFSPKVCYFEGNASIIVSSLSNSIIFSIF